MKNNNFLLSVLIASFVFTLVACSGEDGAAGPQGEPGEDGNANVIASPWIPSELGDNPTTFDFFSHQDPQITEQVTNNAAFLVYGKKFTLSNVDPVLALPVVFDERSYYFELFPNQNSIFFRGQSVDKTTQFVFDDFSEFRYVIIPSADGTSGKIPLPDFKKMTYAEVVQYFELDY